MPAIDFVDRSRHFARAAQHRVAEFEHDDVAFHVPSGLSCGQTRGCNRLSCRVMSSSYKTRSRMNISSWLLLALALAGSVTHAEVASDRLQDGPYVTSSA